MRGLEPGSWAERTIKIRFGETVKRTIAENDFPIEVIKKLELLIAEMPHRPIRHLDDPGGPDLEAWQSYISKFDGQDWLQPPWFFTEHYFYRRIIEAVEYFKRGQDPFEPQKEAGLTLSSEMLIELMTRLQEWEDVHKPAAEILRSLLYVDLWGNQADYSLWPADDKDENKPDHADVSQATEFLLVDDSSKVVEYLLEPDNRISRIDFLIDNAGMELLSDLVFADYLLTSQIADEVHFHLKAHPTFVSDALPIDVEESIAFMGAIESDVGKALGNRMNNYLDSQKLRLQTDFFWNSPLDGWQMPEALRDDLAKAALVFSKGDAQYRRLLGDRHWPTTSLFSDVVSYFPAPIVALRTLKSELVCGLQPGQAEQVAKNDPDWLINGRWGLIQSNIQSTFAGTGVRK